MRTFIRKSEYLTLVAMVRFETVHFDYFVNESSVLDGCGLSPIERAHFRHMELKFMDEHPEYNYCENR